MSNKEIDTLTIGRVSHKLIDSNSRKMITQLVNDNRGINSTLDAHKQGILELAQQLNIIQDNMVKRTSLSIKDINDTSPIILLFENNFSIFIDISIVNGDSSGGIVTYQGTLKCYDIHNKLTTICTNDDIALYAKRVSNGNTYIQCKYKSTTKFDLYMNIVNIDDSTSPKVIVNNGEINIDDMIKLYG